MFLWVEDDLDLAVDVDECDDPRESAETDEAERAGDVATDERGSQDLLTSK